MIEGKWLIIYYHDKHGLLNIEITDNKYSYMSIKQFINDRYCCVGEEVWIGDEYEDEVAGGIKYYESDDYRDFNFRAYLIKEEKNIREDIYKVLTKEDNK